MKTWMMKASMYLNFTLFLHYKEIFIRLIIRAFILIKEPDVDISSIDEILRPVHEERTDESMQVSLSNEVWNPNETPEVLNCYYICCT